jgi:hypothetical protein
LFAKRKQPRPELLLQGRDLMWEPAAGLQRFALRITAAARPAMSSVGRTMPFDDPTQWMT